MLVFPSVELVSTSTVASVDVEVVIHSRLRSCSADACFKHSINREHLLDSPVISCPKHPKHLPAQFFLGTAQKFGQLSFLQGQRCPLVGRFLLLPWVWWLSLPMVVPLVVDNRLGCLLLPWRTASLVVPNSTDACQVRAPHVAIIVTTVSRRSGIA